MESVWVKENWGYGELKAEVQHNCKMIEHTHTHIPSWDLLTTSSSVYWPWGGVLSENRDKEQKAKDKYQELGLRLKCTIGKRHAGNPHKTYNESRHTWKKKKATVIKERAKKQDRQEKQRNEQFSTAVWGVTVYHWIEATARQRAREGEEKRGTYMEGREINKEGQRAGGSSKWIRLRECVR